MASIAFLVSGVQKDRGLLWWFCCSGQRYHSSPLLAMGFMVKSDRRKTPGSFAGGGGPVLLCNPAVAGGPTMTITSASKEWEQWAGG